LVEVEADGRRDSDFAAVYVDGAENKGGDVCVVCAVVGV
jgi:hypothetical protein